jgi:multidrug transporter EmrE-like cation transporter
MNNYEFSTKHNTMFRLLQMRMRFVGFIFITMGTSASIMLLLAKLDYIELLFNYNILVTIFAIFFIISGILLWKAGDAFNKIAKTNGHDIEHLMDAIKDLFLAFDIQMWIIIIGIFFVIITSVFLREFSLI